MQESLGSASDGPVNISLREYLDILRRRRAIILQTFFVVLVVGILISIYTLDVYRSSGRLLLAPNSYAINTINTSDPLADIFQSNQQYSVLTQVEMLQSAELRKKLQENLKNKALPQITVTPVEGTQIINITAEGEDSLVVGDTPNQLMDLYIADQKDNGEARLKAALKNADTNVNKFTKKMDDIDKEIRKFKQKYQISELEKNRDELFDDAARIIVMNQQGSTSAIQRKFSIGYNRAGRIMDQLEAAGIVGQNEGSKARQVLLQDEYALEQLLKGLNQ